MTNKYSFVLAFHSIIICLDFCFNAVSSIFFRDNTTQLMIFMLVLNYINKIINLFSLQDTLIVLGIIVTAIMFSSTYIFQAGLISVLLQNFFATFLIMLIYLLLSIILHVFSLVKYFFKYNKQKLIFFGFNNYNHDWCLI